MYKAIFQKAGLTPTQSSILEYLFEKKEDRASKIAKKIKKSRAIVYKDLEELVALKIIEKHDKANQVSIFRLGHPSYMEKFFDEREAKIKKDREMFNNYLPDMISSYNLMSNKPGVKYYEGFEGLIKTFDNLSKKIEPNSEILSFVKVLDDQNKDSKLKKSLENFVSQRVKKKVHTRVIAFDTEEGRKLKETDSSSFRETKLVSLENKSLDFNGGEIFIYKDEIYSITSHNKTFFVFIIENESISKMLKAFFEVQWKLL